MSCQTHVAAALYRDEPAMDFDDIVDEFELSLRTACAGRRSLTFDHDDLVIIDIDDLRIGLAWIAPDAPGQPYALVIATGNSTELPGAAMAPELCAKVGEKALLQLQKRMPFDSVVRATLAEPLDSDLLDRVAAGLDLLDPGAEAPQEPADTLDMLLAEIATPLALPAPEPDAEVFAEAPAAASRSSEAVGRLRATYDERGPAPQTAALLQSVLGSARTLLGSVSQIAVHGAQHLATGSTSEANPYGRLAAETAYARASRYLGRFDKAEYELYGSLLD